MSTSRKGLKRVGMRRYMVEGDRGAFAIDRDSATRWYVMPPDWPRNGFFAMQFRRLRDARQYAERLAAPNDYWPDDMPKFLRRTKFKKAVQPCQ